MKYSYDFQYMARGSARPSDDGEVVGVTVDDTQFAVIPNVGDYVNIVQITKEPEYATFTGRVRSRLFTYFGKEHCGINIVVEEVDEAIWGELIKE